jgi:hypothetical protein
MVNGADTPVPYGRLPIAAVEAHQTMHTITLRRTTPDSGPPPLERALLRRSVGEQEAHRHRCAHCRRTPLTGEMVHVYAAATGERLVCELCRPLRREPPARSELMHAPEHARTVRVTRRAA